MQKIHTRIKFDIESGLVEEDEFYWYDGPVDLMKASQEQKDAAAANQAFTEQLRTQFQTQFAQTQSIQNSLLNQYNTIATNAENGQGYTPAQLAALNTQNVESNSTNTNNAVQALNRQLVQQSNGAAVPTGAANQLRAQILSNGATSLATGTRNIALGNAQQAQSNLFNSLSGISGVAGQQSSLTGSLLNGSISNGSNSYNEVAQAYQPSNFWGNLATGALSAGLTAVAGPLGGLAGKAIGGAITGSGSSSQTPYDYDTMGA